MVKLVFFFSEPAGAGIMGRHQDEPSWIGQGSLDPADGDHPIFQWLPKHFQSAPGKLREFIQEQDPMVAEGHFSRPWDAPSPD